MKIKIKERNQDRLIKSLKIHWDSATSQYVGNMIDFIDEIMMQSGFSVICYHYNGLGCPISITANKKFEKENEKTAVITELELEDTIDNQLTITKEDGSLTNIWYGKYSHDSALIEFIKKKYKYYFKFGLEQLDQA